MNSINLLLLLLLVIILNCLIQTLIYAQIFQPISQYTDTFLYNGQQQSRNVMTIHCSESSRYGQLVAGAITVNITCIPPKYFYDYIEVGRIPKYQELHAEQICLVDDLNEFNAAETSLEIDQSLQNLLQIQSTARRRLLGIEGIDALTFIPILGPLLTSKNAREAEEDAQNAQDRIDALDMKFQKADATLTALNIWQGQATSTIEGLNQLNTISQTQIQNLVQSVGDLKNAAQQQYQTFQELSTWTNSTTQQLQNNINLIQQQLAASTNASVKANEATFNQLMNLIIKLQNDTTNNINFIQDFIQQLANKQSDLSSYLLMKFRRIQQRRLGQASYFNSLSELDTTLMPLVIEGGLKPNLEAKQLGTPQQRILFETFDLNFVSATQLSSASLYNMQLRFYYGTQYAIDHAKSWSSVNDLINDFGPMNCIRPYIYPTIENNYQTIEIISTKLNPSQKLCGLWIEITTYMCTIPVTNLNNIISWSTISNNKNLNITQQPTQLNQTLCQGQIPIMNPSSAGHFNNSNIILKTFNDFMSFYRNNICSRLLQQDGLYQLYARRWNSISYIKQLTDSCSLNINSLLSLSNQNTYIPILILMILHRIFPQIRKDAYSYELLFNGRLPAGLTTSVDYFVYTPTQLKQFQDQSNPNNNITEPILDGSADPSECVNLWWVAVSHDTLPVYSIRPFTSGNYINKEVDVTISNTNNDPNVYSIPSPSTDVTLIDELPKPNTFISVGGLSLPDALYDVPDGSAPVTNNLFERSRRITYYLMKPGTTETIPLSEFLLENRLGYDARDAAVSASEYRVGMLRDKENYPVCSVPGGVPPPDQMSGNIQPTNRICIEPYNWVKPINDLSLPSFIGLPLSYCNYLTSTNQKLIYYDAYNEQINQNFIQSNLANADGLIKSMFCGGIAWSISVWINIPPSTTTTIQTYTLFGFQYQDDYRYINNVRFVINNGIPNILIQQKWFSTNGIITINPLIPNTIRVDHGTWHYLEFEYTGTSTTITTTNGRLPKELHVRVDSIDVGYLSNIQFNIRQSAYASISAFIPPLNFGSLASASFFSYWSNQVFSEKELSYHMACEIDLLQSRCSSGQSNEQMIIAAEPIQSTHGTLCQISTILYYNQIIQDLYQTKINLPNKAFISGSWSLSFWIHTSPSSVCLSNNIGNLINFGTNILTIKYDCSSTSSTVNAQQYLNINIYGSIINTQTIIADGQYHFITITYDQTNSLISIYVDTFLDNTLSNIQIPLTITTTIITLNVIANNFISMIRYYDNMILTLPLVVSERQCQLDSIFNTGGYNPPIGTCTYISNNNLNSFQYGYCRRPNMCNGHCSAYSFIDINNGIFYPSTYQCDTGYAPPDCINRCKHIDLLSGECLDLAPGIAYSQGLIPGSSWCSTLATHKASIFNITTNQGISRQIMSLEPRLWVYEAIIYVPTGNYVNILGSSACPSVRIVPLKDAYTNIEMYNNLNQQIQIRVYYYSIDDLNANGNACQMPCCNLPGKPMSIPAFTTSSLTIPPCGNMTVGVERLISPVDFTYQTCTELSAEIIQQEVATINTIIPLAYEQRITIANDQLAKQLFELNQQTQLSLLQLMIIAGKSGIEDQVFKDLIKTVYIDIQNRTNQLLELNTPINLTDITPFYINKTLQDSIQSSLDEVANNLETQNELKQQYDTQYNQINNSIQLLKQQSQNFSSQLLLWLNDIRKPLPDRYQVSSDNPFGFLSDIGNDVANLVNTVGGGVFGILNAPASIFSSVKNFINSIITLLPLIGIITGSVLLGIFIGPSILKLSFNSIKIIFNSMSKNNNLMTTTTTTDNIPRSPSHIMSVHDSGPEESTSDLSPLIPKNQQPQQQHQTGTSLRYNQNAAQIARIAARTRTQKQKQQKHEF